jgi:hypothetical protein
MVEQVLKSSIAYKTLDNITVVVLAFRGLIKALQSKAQQSERGINSEESKSHNNNLDEEQQNRESG